MIFGAIAVEEAEGAILAHSQKLEDRRLKKGTRLGATDVAGLKAAGFATIVAARLEEGDLTEDVAAQKIGEALGGAHIRVADAATGRANLFTRTAGLFVPDRSVVDAVNAVDPGITLATLGEYAPVDDSQMLATIKIIPLAVAGASVDAVLERLTTSPAFRLAPFAQKRVALIQTRLDTIKCSVLDKTRRVTDARLEASGSTIVCERRCAHDVEPLAAALRQIGDVDLTLVFGASAVIDAEDVIPAAIRVAGGSVTHLGMPVDPGNLLLLGTLGGKPVLGAPGCARSAKENGFDWILNRLLADLDVTVEDIRGMGVGGLLTEIASRPQPRDGRAKSATPDKPTVDIVLLAAGRSSRMGGPNKLLATFDGVPLIRRSAETALAARAQGAVRVVVGHMREAIIPALEGLDVDIVVNPDFAEGLSTSLKAGFAASATSDRRADGVLVMLADQPFLKPAHLDALIDAFEPTGPGSIAAAFDGEKRRNPVLISCVYRDEITGISGDVGAQGLIAAHPEAIIEVDIGPAASVDVDTPESMASAGGSFTEPARR